MAKSELIKYGVVGVLILAFLFALTRIFKGAGQGIADFLKAINPLNIVSEVTDSKEDKEKKETVENAQKKVAEESKLLRTLNESQAQIIANNIKSALLDGWFSEDEEVIIENVKKIQNQGDYDLVSAKYGCVKNWQWFSSPMTMIQHIRDLIHGSDLQEIEDWFNKHNISY